GHYLIGGYTNAADPVARYALVYDNTTVVARSNDPIDLDGNGVFDDDAFVDTFDRVVLTSDNAALALVTLWHGDAALCQKNTFVFGQAIIRIQLPSSGACCQGTVCTVTGPAACTGSYKGDNSTCQAP